MLHKLLSLILFFILPFQVNADLTEAEIQQIRFLENQAKDWNGDIIFYGKLIDQNGNAVQNAKITFSIMAYEESILEKIQSEIEGDLINSKEIIRATDEQGMFYINDIRGMKLNIYDIKAEGYVANNYRRSFGFGKRESYQHIANKNEPIEYVIWKKGESEALIQVGGFGTKFKKQDLEQEQIVHIFKENSPWYNEKGAFIVNAYLEKSNQKNQYDWGVIIETIDGGIQITEDLYPYLAPEKGYEEILKIEFKVGQTDWLRKIEKQIYFKQANKYGTCKLNIRTRSSKKVIVGCSNTFLNPSGSRNLEVNQNNIL